MAGSLIGDRLFESMFQPIHAALPVAFFALAGILAITHAQQHQGEGSASSYAGAFYSSGGAGLNQQRLEVFPISGASLSIPLEFPLGRLVYATDGKSIYTTARVFGTRWGIAKLEFLPTRSTPLLGSSGVDDVHSFAVSTREEKIVFSGRYNNGEDMGCGLFELVLATQRISKVFEGTPDCGYVSAWLHISLSPDGLRAVAVRKHRVELIDLVTGATKSLGDGFSEAAWSPDGHWIAAFEDGSQEKAVLIQTEGLSNRRMLKTSGVQWSPDSKYLLGFRGGGCGLFAYSGSLEMVDILSGKRTTIKSSKCKVNQSTTGWVTLGNR